jgi:transcriptional regulator with XRE-family HTH domain
MSFGERLQTARKLAGLNQGTLSELAGLSRGLVWAIEDGLRPDPTVKTAKALAAVLGISLDWLVTGTGAKPTEEQIRRSVRRAQRSTGTDG